MFKAFVMLGSAVVFQMRREEDGESRECGWAIAWIKTTSTIHYVDLESSGPQPF